MMDESPLHDAVWRERLVGQVRQDVTQAHTVVWADSQLQIESWSGGDRQTGEANHEPARLVYHLRDGGAGGQVLVRDQRDLLDLGQQKPAATLMAFGIESWSVEANRDDTDSGSSTSVGGDRNLVIQFQAGDQISLALPPSPDSGERSARREGLR